MARRLLPAEERSGSAKWEQHASLSFPCAFVGSLKMRAVGRTTPESRQRLAVQQRERSSPPHHLLLLHHYQQQQQQDPGRAHLVHFPPQNTFGHADPLLLSFLPSLLPSFLPRSAAQIPLSVVFTHTWLGYERQPFSGGTPERILRRKGAASGL